MNRTKKIGLSLLALLCCILATAQTAVTKGEYWFDQQFDSRQMVTLTEGVWNQQIDVSTLGAGIHTLAIRVGTDDNRWGSVLSKYFIVPQYDGTSGESSLVRYEYWIDRQFDQRVSGTFAEGGIIDCDLDLPTLVSGLHAISFRAIDSYGQASPVVTQYFIVPQIESVEENAVVAYRYWIDDDDAKEGTMDAGGIANIEIDIDNLSKGLHRINYQVKDKFERYSPVCTSFFMVGLDAAETNQIVAYEYWFNDQPHTRVAVDAANVVTIDEEISIEGVAPETVLADYQFDVENKQVIFTHDVLFSFLAFNNAGISTEAVTEIIKDHKSAMDIPFTKLSLEKETEIEAPVGNQIQGYEFNCQIGDKVYWFVKAESQHIDFYDAEGNLLTVETETIGDEQALVIMAPTSTIYVLTYGAEGENAKDVIRVAQPIEIAFENTERAYGDENQTFTYVTERPDLLVGIPVGVTEATATSGIGDYTITLDPTSISNSLVTVTDATLTITKAKLTITADDIEVYQDEVMPTLTWKAEGWKNDEDESVLTVQPVCTTEGTPTSPLGDYTITVSGAEAANYDITYVDGKLTVSIPVGISSIDANVAPADIYTLQGIKVRSKSESLDGLADGYYIVNRRKVFIRRR